MKAFISYQDGTRTVEGTFELIRRTDTFIEIESNKNTLIIPFHKINKIKFPEMKGGNK